MGEDGSDEIEDDAHGGGRPDPGHGQTDQQGLLRPARQREALDRYAANYRAFFDEIRTFVERFYDRTKYKEYYYDLAQEIVDPDRLNAPSIDFVTLISGLSGKHPLLNIRLDDLIANVTET